MSALARAKNICFESLELLDEGLHSRGFTWVRLCCLVGRLERAYYERNMDWENPIYVKPPALSTKSAHTRATPECMCGVDYGVHADYCPCAVLRPPTPEGGEADG